MTAKTFFYSAEEINNLLKFTLFLQSVYIVLDLDIGKY